MRQYKDIVGGASTYKRCFESHPALPIGKFSIFGGSCIHPVIKDADIYVGFDRGMSLGEKAYPWVDGHSFLFHILDGGVPTDLQQSLQLVDWLALNLSSKKKIHLGCIGGHGRTGLILSALVKTITGEMDAVEYVRKHYCKKAVESSAQIDWLHKHFGIAKAKPSKDHLYTSGKVISISTGGWQGAEGKSSFDSVKKSTPSSGSARVLEPLVKDGCLWGANAF